MRFKIVSRGLRLSSAMHNYLERRAQFALGRFAAAIHTVQISVLDENGPRGGIDKRCRVLLSLQRGEPLVVEGLGDQLERLFADTLERAGRTVARTIKRTTTRRSEWRPVA
jgi:putative sigma-54 modulation protein